MPTSEDPTTHDSDLGPRSPLSRRQLLALLGAGGALAATGGIAATRDGGPPGVALPSGPSPLPAARPVAAITEMSERRLVVVELNGGNDGLSTVVPTRDGTLRMLRPDLMRPAEELASFTDSHTLHPGLAALRERGLAVLDGVGTPSPDGSHFEMETRWWRGDAAGDGRIHTGFLGRVCDELDVGAPVTGVSIGSGASPALLGEKATTIALPDPSAGWFLQEREEWFVNLRRGLESMGTLDPAEGDRVAAARRGLDDALAFAEVLGTIDEEDDRGFPETDLGRRLRTVSALLDADIGVRVAHVPFGGFDTHDGQMYQHDDLMTDLGASLAALRDDFAARGIDDRTLVVTTSEFGRRPEQNGAGTDHGTAGPALLCGPVVAGHHGEAPRLDRLDDNGNLVATTMLDDYYATLAETWFGIPAGEVLAGGTPLNELLAV